MKHGFTKPSVMTTFILMAIVLYVLYFLIRNDLLSEYLESLSIEVTKLKSKPFVATTWYIPPNSSLDWFQHFETLVGKLDSESVEHIIR